MYLSSRELSVLMDITICLNNCTGGDDFRYKLGNYLLDFLQADYFASYVWSPNQSIFDSRVSINMDDDNLTNYENYFQHHDPITPLLQKQQKATLVHEVMPQNELVQTEFFNDFLKRDGLYYGINMYGYHNKLNIGDVRIWRSAERGDFDRRDVEKLELIRPHFADALWKSREYELNKSKPAIIVSIEQLLIQEFDLTQREADIAMGVIRGQSDADIADKLFIAHSTVRTHMKHIFDKFNVKRRGCLASRLFSVIDNEHFSI